MDVMLAVDLSSEPKALIERALPWATRLGARLHLRAVAQMVWLPDEGMGGPATLILVQEWERHRANETRQLQELSASMPQEVVGPPKLLSGYPDLALVEEAQHFDLLAVGTHGRTGLGRALYGSVAERVVRHADTAVLVLPLASEPILAHGPLHTIVPIDARTPSFEAAQWVGDRLAAADIQLHVVNALADLHVSQELGLLPPSKGASTHPHREWAERRLREGMEEADIQGDLHFVVSAGSNPADELVRFARAQLADLIVMSTQGRKGLSRMAVSSVAERVLRRASSPTLIVR